VGAARRGGDSFEVLGDPHRWAIVERLAGGGRTRRDRNCSGWSGVLPHFCAAGAPARPA